MFKKIIATAVIFTGVTLVPVAIAAPHGGGALGGSAPHASVGAAPAARSAGPSFRGPGASAARVYGMFDALDYPVIEATFRPALQECPQNASFLTGAALGDASLPPLS